MSSESVAEKVKPQKEKNSLDMKKGTFVRRYVIRNPEANLKEIQDAWVSEGHPEKNKPASSQEVYLARTQIKKKFGIKNLNDIPKKKSGEINATGLVRLIRKRKPSISFKACQTLLAKEGIEISHALWSAMINYEKKNPTSVAEKSINKTSRKKTSRKSTKLKASSKVHQNTTSVDALVNIEVQLDSMIENVRSINQSEVVELLRDARRFLSSKILRAKK